MLRFMSSTQQSPISQKRYDVVIAGARCAGASTAMLLARQGLKVLVVDPTSRRSDTLSTHALMRGAVLQLHRWGVLGAVRAASREKIVAGPLGRRRESPRYASSRSTSATAPAWAKRLVSIASAS